MKSGSRRILSTLFERFSPVAMSPDDRSLQSIVTYMKHCPNEDDHCKGSSTQVVG